MTEEIKMLQDACKRLYKRCQSGFFAIEFDNSVILIHADIVKWCATINYIARDVINLVKQERLSVRRFLEAMQELAQRKRTKADWVMQALQAFFESTKPRTIALTNELVITGRILVDGRNIQHFELREGVNKGNLGIWLFRGNKTYCELREPYHLRLSPSYIKAIEKASHKIASYVLKELRM